MRANGWRGVACHKKVRTTIADPAAARAADLVKRKFRVPAPNMLLVADFTYVRMAFGAVVYTAFAIDAYAGRIVGWTCSASKETGLYARPSGTPRNSDTMKVFHCWAALFIIQTRARKADSIGRRNTGLLG